MGRRKKKSGAPDTSANTEPPKFQFKTAATTTATTSGSGSGSGSGGGGGSDVPQPLKPGAAPVAFTPMRVMDDGAAQPKWVVNSYCIQFNTI
jgi:hypothetical protein